MNVENAKKIYGPRTKIKENFITLYGEAKGYIECHEKVKVLEDFAEAVATGRWSEYWCEEQAQIALKKWRKDA